MEKLVYEEFDTTKHEVLAICMETPTTAVGISLFMNDREAEYYWEKFPECCVKHTNGDDYMFRNLLTAVSYWGPKWTSAGAPPGSGGPSVSLRKSTHSGFLFSGLITMCV